MPGAGRTAIGITGNQGAIETGSLELMPGVDRMHSRQQALQTGQQGSEARKLRGANSHSIGRSQLRRKGGRHHWRALRHRDARADIHDCGEDQSAGGRLFRGGAYKPRTSPYSFQGMGEEGLKILIEARDQFGLGIITEAIDNESLDLVEKYADVIQIGARNMQNFSLLKRAGRARKPVLLKRGMSATLDEFLMAAEYIMCEGNYNVILCERGVRTFTDHTRNTLDLSVVPAVQRLSHLPIVVDPSHGTGRRNKVLPLSRASIAVGRGWHPGRGTSRPGEGAIRRAAVDPARGIQPADARGARYRRSSRPHTELKYRINYRLIVLLIFLLGLAAREVALELRPSFLRPGLHLLRVRRKHR